MADLSKEIGNSLEIIRKDWDKLPNFIKFCYITGIFILVSGWLIKMPDRIHNKTAGPLLIGLTLAFVIILPTFYWFMLRIKIYIYRAKYPIKNIGKDFQFVILKGAVHLVDSKRKQIRWVENPKTLYDLGYFPSVWTRIVEVNNFAETVKADSRDRNLSNYKLKRGLRTRGKPGEGKI